MGGFRASVASRYGCVLFAHHAHAIFVHARCTQGVGQAITGCAPRQRKINCHSSLMSVRLRSACFSR
ncbi:hypothetical protein DOT37_21030 [Pantoea agglomerans]|nr:hypothetical protein DOT37_21030 [Pantoea agglomerans]TGX89366.1 hypothetical protein E5821_20240 [Pantoea agglomerans]